MSRSHTPVVWTQSYNTALAFSCQGFLTSQMLGLAVEGGSAVRMNRHWTSKKGIEEGNLGRGWVGPREVGNIREGKGKGGGETLKVRRGDYSGPRIGELQECRAKNADSTVLAIHSEGRGELQNRSTVCVCLLDHGLRQGVEKKEWVIQVLPPLIKLFIYLLFCACACMPCCARGDQRTTLCRKFSPPTFMLVLRGWTWVIRAPASASVSSSAHPCSFEASWSTCCTFKGVPTNTTT